MAISVFIFDARINLINFAYFVGLQSSKSSNSISTNNNCVIKIFVRKKDKNKYDKSEHEFDFDIPIIDISDTRKKLITDNDTDTRFLMDSYNTVSN